MRAVLGKWGKQFEEAVLHQVTAKVWRVEAGSEAYTLKRRADHATVWSEYNLLAWLKSRGLPVLPPMLSVDKVPWVHHGGEIYVLYPYVQGSPGEGVCPTDLGKARSLGAFLARLHGAMAEYPKADEFPRQNLYGEVISWAWPTARKCLSGHLRGRLEDIGESIAQFSNLYEGLPRQLIHRDAHPGNVVFEGDDVVGMLDFTMVRTEARIFDVCYCATAVLSNCFPKGPIRESWDLFVQELLRSYVEIQPLDRSEGYAFVYMAYLIQVLFAAYYFDLGLDDQASENIAVLTWLYDRQSALESLIDRVIRDRERGLDD
ncbi:MAG TPA: phosphotransferase [Firmicutes bacterium]|nr:MAG: hypothetical protein AA931_01530 [Peptococcaceae bacterium 1109]HHT72836.1 phosphotransferase [Bacillota bacterium]